VIRRAGPPEALGRLEALAESALRLLGVPESVELSVTVTNDEEIARLNEHYLQHEGPTDVLAFPQDEVQEAGEDAEGEPLLLGDVVISVDTAARQAKERGHSLQAEVEYLLLHGILHLLGRRDYNETERRAMLGEQLELAQRLGVEVNE